MMRRLPDQHNLASEAPSSIQIHPLQATTGRSRALAPGAARPFGDSSCLEREKFLQHGQRFEFRVFVGRTVRVLTGQTLALFAYAAVLLTVLVAWRRSAGRGVHADNLFSFAMRTFARPCACIAHPPPPFAGYLFF